MDQFKPKQTPSSSSKPIFLQTIRNLFHFQHSIKKKSAKSRDEHRTLVLEAFIAKLFAAISATKAAYAHLQIAHSPFRVGAIQSSDECVEKHLRILSELKREFSANPPHSCPPHVTILLAEIQEQQSLIATFETALKALEFERKWKNSKLRTLTSRLHDCEDRNEFTEKKNGCFLGFGNLQLNELNPTHFVQFLHAHTLKSIQVFVQHLVFLMETKNWDLESAAMSIHPNVVTPSHRSFVFESFVAREMFEGFNSPHLIDSHPIPEGQSSSEAYFFQRFNEFKSANPKHFIASNSAFAGFTKEKYLKLVHPKMEISFFGNVRHRNLVTSGNHPDTGFFEAFAEMSKQVWLLHCLGRSLGEGARVFQVRKNCRFSEVFMESVNEDELGRVPFVDDRRVVAFTVVPGFRIGKVVIQCQVFLSPMER